LGFPDVAGMAFVWSGMGDGKEGWAKDKNMGQGGEN
jgi:hypothetical protein